MLNIALYHPKIPQNTGNIIRFAANTGIALHLIHPLGFAWQDKKLRRAGLDYHEFATITHHDNWHAFLQASADARRFIITTKGKQSAYEMAFLAGDFLIFGAEDSGIASQDMQDIEQSHWLRLPMKANSRSMNLANTVAILGYEVMRQWQFPDLR